MYLVAMCLLAVQAGVVRQSHAYFEIGQVLIRLCGWKWPNTNLSQMSVNKLK